MSQLAAATIRVSLSIEYVIKEIVESSIATQSNLEPTDETDNPDTDDTVDTMTPDEGDCQQYQCI